MMNSTQSDSLDTSGSPSKVMGNVYSSNLQAIAMACLYPLVLFNLVQVFAAFSAIQPHPPLQFVPLIVATAGLGVSAIPLVQKSISGGYIVAIIFALFSMIGMGPHKLFLENGQIIAPVAIVGFVAAVLLLIVSVKALRKGSL